MEENLILQKEESITDTNIIEVKNRKFNKPFNLEDTILYDGHVFKKDSHQTNNYLLIINYSCKNYKKIEELENHSYVMLCQKRK